MDYVEKMITSTAETAFLAGAEQSSTLMCERLNSALDKVCYFVFLELISILAFSEISMIQVGEECAANKNAEDELLKLQEAYVIKLGELYEREWKHNSNPAEVVVNEEPIASNELPNANLVRPRDIFEDVHEIEAELVL